VNLTVNVLAQKSVRILPITPSKLKLQTRAWLLCYIFAKELQKAS